MKLKRFLLRYEPPGVGLEVEIDGVIDVRHKDLWLASFVKSSREVNLLVDKLIAEEPEILVRRKHRPALVQLLSRLYHVEGARSPSSPISPSETQSDSLGSSLSQPESMGLLPGKQVVLVGLKGNLQAHNGDLGTLVKGRTSTGDYEILLKSQQSPSQADVLKLKSAENILPVSLTAGLAPGALAVLCGLRSQMDLNGCVCRVVKCHGEVQRYEVLALETGLHYRVKCENVLAALPCQHSQAVAAMHEDSADSKPPSSGAEALAKPGSTVQIVCLKAAAASASDFNGQLAEVLRVDSAGGRYVIRLRDGCQKVIRTSNVRLVSGPSIFPAVAGTCNR